MKVLVTGADGYLASGVIRKLLEEGCDVVGFGLGPTPEIHSDHFLYKRGNSFDLGVDGLVRVAPDAVLHLAWRNGFKHGDSCHIDDLPGHYRFVCDCVAAHVPRLAIMGSMHEVGYHEGAVNANTACSPTTPYAIAKNALRQLAFGECSNSDTSLLWMRGFYIVSADGRGDSIFAKIITAEREGKDKFPFTSGKSKYDFIDYPDFCSQVAKVVRDGRSAGIVNICSGRPESLASRVERFIRENGLKISLEYGAFPDRPYDSPEIFGEPMGHKEP